MGRMTKAQGFELDDLDREPPSAREEWMARHAVPGGIITATLLGVSAGLAFAITVWWLGVALGIVYAAVGIALWAQPVRKVSAWRRKRREADRLFASYAGGGEAAPMPSHHAASTAVRENGMGWYSPFDQSWNRSLKCGLATFPD